MQIKEEIAIERNDLENRETEEAKAEKKHYHMPISKMRAIAQNMLDRMASVYDEDDEETRSRLNEMVNGIYKQENCSGDAKDFHNFAVALSRGDEYALACAVLDCGLDRFPKNVDLLSDYLQSGIKCGKTEEVKRRYKQLQKIPNRKYTWRGFTFQIEYLRYLMDQVDSDKQIDAYVEQMMEIVKEFKKYSPYSEEPYRAEADIYKDLNMVDKEIEVLREAMEKIEICPKCSLRYADLMLEIGRYEEAKKAIERGKSDATQTQASVSEGYIYYLSALCTIAAVSKEKRDYRKEEVMEIYSDFNLALKEFRNNKTYAGVIKSKTNMLVSKTHIEVDESDFEELANILI